MSVCMSVCICVCMSVSLSLSVSFWFSLSLALFKSLCQSVQACLSVCLFKFVHLSVCLSLQLTLIHLKLFYFCQKLRFQIFVGDHLQLWCLHHHHRPLHWLEEAVEASSWGQSPHFGGCRLADFEELKLKFIFLKIFKKPCCFPELSAPSKKLDVVIWESWKFWNSLLSLGLKKKNFWVIQNWVSVC